MSTHWTEYAVHNEHEIKGFFGDYRFLSNFELCPIEFEGQMYPSVENAYQAAKTRDEALRSTFRAYTPSRAKIKGREMPLRPGWDGIKKQVMRQCIRDKFERNGTLRTKLIMTGRAYLEETNHWGDEYWGVNYKTRCGENQLGELLMETRQRFYPVLI